MISRDDDRANRPVANEITAADRQRILEVYYETAIARKQEAAAHEVLLLAAAQALALGRR